MGVTIHFTGRAKDLQAANAAILTSSQLAHELGWQCRSVDIPETEIYRFDGEQETCFTGRLFGVVIDPHPDCESLSILFADDLVMEEFCKTQFAGVDTHIAVVEFLKHISGDFESFEVIDEGEYWESQDRSLLENRLEVVDRLLEQI